MSAKFNIYFGSHEFPFPPVRGTWKIKCGSLESDPISYNESPQSALESLFGMGNVAVVSLDSLGQGDFGWQVEINASVPSLLVIDASTIAKPGSVIFQPQYPPVYPTEPQNPEGINSGIDDVNVTTGNWILYKNEEPFVTIPAGSTGSDVATLLNTAGYACHCESGSTSASSFSIWSEGPEQNAWHAGNDPENPLGRPGTMSVEPVV